MSHLPAISATLSKDIWQRKYRFTGRADRPADQSIQDTFRRVAQAAAKAEKGGSKAQEKWAARFYEAMADFGFVPAGRILAGAQTERKVTLFNCFVLGRIPDDLGGILDAVKDAALTLQAGGGIGHDFSTIRPRGAAVNSIDGIASGPIHFMDVWDAMCRTLLSAGQRRGAMMGTLRCDHPDIEEFIAVKSDPARLRNFNLSVLVTDAFMRAIESDEPWPLLFEGETYRTVNARALWDKIMRATYDYAEPGVIFIDRVNAQNNLAYCEEISATNPCGEQPLPPFGACLLGSINLARMVRQPFTRDAGIDTAELEQRVEIAIRMLDNFIDVSRYPLKEQKREAKRKRRIGLGVTGLADALIFCGLDYASMAGRDCARRWMEIIQNAAYRASAKLAKEKGCYPLYDENEILQRPNIQRLSRDVQNAIEKHGLRNGCLTSIAPTGTISLLAGNVSSGVEPVFDFIYERRITRDVNQFDMQRVEDYAHAVFQQTFGNDAPLSDVFVTAETIAPDDHLAMQAALQPFVDSAISKTINCSEDMDFEPFKNVYRTAYEMGLKGCTTYRPNDITGAVLSHESHEETADIKPETTTVPDSLDEVPVPLSEIHPLVSGEAKSSDANSDRSIIYMSEPLARDAALEGVTYKIKWPASAHALYVTINDTVREGRRRPFEIFINTKNLEHHSWTVALTRMISAVFRRGGDVSFVAEELKAIFDPEGGQWIKGHYVPSLIAAIGDVIEQHMIRIGFLQKPDDAQSDETLRVQTRDGKATSATRRRARVCPSCGSRQLRLIEGCWTCAECHFTRCG